MKRRRTELTDSLMGPKISSTLPIWVLLCRYIGALKKGIFSFVSFVTASPSHAWTNDETSAHAQKKKTITLFSPKASLFQQNTNRNHETKQTYDFGRWALVAKATASTTTTKTATSKTAAATSVSATSKTTATAPTAPASRWSHGSVIKQREWVVSVAPELYTIEGEAQSRRMGTYGVIGEKGLGF